MKVEVEKDAVQDVIAAGKRWGYGNMILRLKWGWVLELLHTTPSMAVKAAMQHVGLAYEVTQRLGDEPREAIIAEIKRYIYSD